MTLPVLPRLYVVSDRHQVPEGTFHTKLSQVMSCRGIMLQLREKDLSTRELLSVARTAQSHAVTHQVPLLINDRLDIVMGVGAAGVHLRSESLPVRQVRRCLGPDKIIGKSVHSVDEARRSEEEGVDFVVLGPIFDTPSKRSYGRPLGIEAVSHARAACRIPLYAIGGITIERVTMVKQAGAYGVATISAIWCSEEPSQAVKYFSTCLGVPD